MDITAKARHFASLHKPGEPLVLYNAWDAGSAKVIENAGAKAIATGSWSVSAAQGCPDGEELPLDLLVAIAERIAKTTSLPVSIDFESGYAAEPEHVAPNAARLMRAGAVGVNFEDQIIGAAGKLYDRTTQSDRIAAIRRMAGPDFFINARTDVFLNSDPKTHEAHLEDALKRAKSYQDAGASGFFAPGLTDPNLIRSLCEDCELPVNIMHMPDAPSLRELAGLGVARISCGPFPYRDLMKSLEAQARAVFGSVDA